MGMMNMIFHGIESPNLFRANTLTQKHFQDTVLGRKSTIWAYEQEQRIQFDLNILKHTEDSEGKELLLFGIPKASIKSVVLGCRFPDEEMGHLVEITRKAEYSELKILKSEAPVEHYRLDYRLLSLNSSEVNDD